MDIMDYFNSSKSSLFRFEALQTYEVESEDMSDSGMKDWWDFIKTKTSAGIIMQRVRLVTEPYTKYTTKELELHKKSMLYGDDIRIIKEESFKKLDILLQDFWLIDDSQVLLMNYSRDGNYINFSVQENIEEYLLIKRKLLENSIPLI